MCVFPAVAGPSTDGKAVDDGVLVPPEECRLGSSPVGPKLRFCLVMILHRQKRHLANHSSKPPKNGCSYPAEQFSVGGFGTHRAALRSLPPVSLGNKFLA